MKKIVFYAVVSALLVVLPTPLAFAGTIIHTVNYDIGNMTTGSDTLGGVTYTTVHYDGLFNSGTPGMPSLPVDYIRFSVPWNATNFRIAALPRNDVSINVSYPVFPCQQHTIPPTVTLPDISAYYSNPSYPSQNAFVVDEGMVAGENHIVTIAVMPVSYCHIGTGQSAIDMLRIPQTISLTLNYDLGNNSVLYPITRRDTVLRNKGFEQAQEQVVNPGDVRSNSFSLSSSNRQLLTGYYPEYPEDVDNPLTYLIVATPESQKPMRRLAALRRQKGMNVKIVTVSEAVNDPLAGQGDLIAIGGEPYIAFNDNAGKLRQYLKMLYYYSGTEYVLLAGSGVPYRENKGGHTDMYYSELNVDWGITYNSYGALNVGRLLGSQADLFDNYTDKLLRYELNPGNGDYSYLNRALATEGTGFLTYGHAGTLSSTFSNITEIFPDLDETEVYGCDVIDSISSNHYGLMTTFNEGFPSGIRIYGEDDNLVSHYIWAIDSIKVAPDVSDIEIGNGLNLMDNKDYPMIYLAPVGQTMPYEQVNGYGTGANFGESFTMGKDYGGPAYLGLTKELNYVYAADFIGAYLDQLNMYPTLSRALNEAKISMHNNSYKEEITSYYNQLGDPVLRIWKSTPQEYSNIIVTRTNNAVTIAGLPSGTTNVAYHSNDGTTGLCKTSSSTLVLNDISPNSTIMLYDNNHIPYIAPLVLQNTDLENSQYVIADDVKIGNNVDSNRPTGNVAVKSGADYEIEAAGDVVIPSGFEVELGASFSVYRSTYK